MRCLHLSILILLFTPSLLAAAESVAAPAAQIAEVPAPPPARNLFAEEFYLRPEQQVKYQTSEINGFILVETPEREAQSRYSIVTDFGGSVLKMQQLAGIKSLEEAKTWIEEHLEVADFEGVEVRKLTVPLPGSKTTTLYWVGHKAFSTSDEAVSQIALLQSVVESQGGNFQQMTAEAQAYIPPPEEEQPLPVTPAQQEREEKLILRYLDQLDVGNELFGPFQGIAMGEPILWQSFGETSWRMTNLDKKNFSDQVGFWTNRIVFKGIRAPLNTIDLFIEMTGALESHGADFASHLDFSAGGEWRPFARNPALFNYRPYSIPILIWLQNNRFYVQYFDRKNLKDEIEGSKDYDFTAGVQLFYEFGVDVPPAAEGPPTTVPDWLRRYVWGEIFYNHRYEWTNFSSEENFNAFIFNSNIIIGFHMPGIPLPSNPINDELAIMPYVRFEHVNNSELSAHFQNRFFVAAGARWMPFRNYRYKENEWLSKTKIFAEYVGVGSVHNTKFAGDDSTPPIDYDVRFGISMSERRF